MKDHLYIFDISNFIHRAYHVHKDLATPDGFPTGAIYGTFGMLFNFIKKYRPHNILVCYDACSIDSMRKAIYPEYKANRATTTAISAQEMIIRHMLYLMGITGIEMPGWEADDIIASAVKQYRDTHDITIVTGDKDLLQLFGPGVQILDTMKNMQYTQEDIDKKFNVQAHQISDFLAIAGDTADNIPGVPGIGAKGASKLLQQYESLQKIYDSIDEIKGALGKKLEANKEKAFISQKLSHLYDDLELPMHSIQFRPTHNDSILELFQKLHLKSHLPRLAQLWQWYA